MYRGVAESPFTCGWVSFMAQVTCFGIDPDKGLSSYNCNETFISSVGHEIYTLVFRIHVNDGHYDA